jgi:hypothetical protein
VANKGAISVINDNDDAENMIDDALIVAFPPHEPTVEFQTLIFLMCEIPPLEQYPVPNPQPFAERASEHMFAIKSIPIDELDPGSCVLPVPIPAPAIELTLSITEFEIVIS